MSRANNAWIEEDMDNGLGDLEDHNISIFLENIRRKGPAYERQIFEAYFQASKSHLPLAFVGLGHFYRFGIGVAQNHIQAMMCYIKASGLGYKPILIHAARRFRLGEGVDIDYDRAVNCCFTCLDNDEFDIHLCFLITLEILQIYSRINNSRFNLKKDNSGFKTVDEHRVEVVLNKVGAQLGCVFDYPLKHKRRKDREIYLLNMKKLEEIADRFSMIRNRL